MQIAYQRDTRVKKLYLRACDCNEVCIKLTVPAFVIDCESKSKRVVILLNEQQLPNAVHVCKSMLCLCCSYYLLTGCKGRNHEILSPKF